MDYNKNKMNFAEQKQKIEKGCGIPYKTPLDDITQICGEYEDDLCPYCKAKLAQLEIDMKMVEEAIRECNFVRCCSKGEGCANEIREKLFGGNNEKA